MTALPPIVARSSRSMLPRMLPISKVKVGFTVPVSVVRPPVPRRKVPTASSTMLKLAALVAPPLKVSPEVPTVRLVPA